MATILKNKAGETFKLCVTCKKEVTIEWSPPECAMCLINRDEGGSG